MMRLLLNLCGVLFVLSVVYGNTIEERLELLEGQQRDNVKENDNIRQLLTEHKNTVTKQQTKIETQGKIISELKTELQLLKRSSVKTQHQVKRNRLLISVLRGGNQHTTKGDLNEPYKEAKMNTILGEQNVQKTKSISRGIRQVSGGIAFSVYLDHNIDHPGQYQTVKFNQVLLNDGNGYNIHSGVFTCSESGVYLFSYFIGERDVNEVYTRLVKNSALETSAVVQTEHATQDLQGGNVVIIRANSGDVVWVEIFANEHLKGNSGTRLTTFSGVFLYA